jgi:hypothetical protein
VNCTRCGLAIKPGDAVQTALDGMPQERLCPKCWGKRSSDVEAEAEQRRRDIEECSRLEGFGGG